jgi:hypothetical protein
VPVRHVILLMRKIHLLVSVFVAVICLTAFTSLRSEKPLKDGDIVFIVNPGGQGKAIQLATKSKYTHVGIIFIENGKPMVYHAVEPVSKNTFEEFVDMSADGKYYIRRLKDQSLLSQEKIGKMLTEARSLLGKHYDLAFNWSDEELYCSEFVWKIYNHALAIEVGKPRPLKEFDLSHPAVKAKLEERYGKKIPLNENMISPGDMYDSALLE